MPKTKIYETINGVDRTLPNDEELVEMSDGDAKDYLTESQSHRRNALLAKPDPYPIADPIMAMFSEKERAVIEGGVNEDYSNYSDVVELRQQYNQAKGEIVYPIPDPPPEPVVEEKKVEPAPEEKKEEDPA